ncbi:MAG: hypothetical protein ABJ240_16915 [Parasphingorhabdus sp.]|uniref:hypothetical protein n=1 Tax=Parasphingorhabdus sp. TaxID=2709688 RepID=UPI0032980FF9
MAKVLKTVAIVAGAVALASTGIGAFAGGALAASAASAGAIASVVSAAASVGANLLTKAPPARGNVSNVVIASNAPSPYMMGRTYSGGVVRHDAAYGGTVDKVPNPYRIIVTVYSSCGPIQAIEAMQADYSDITFSSGAATGYFNSFLYSDTQLGATPESSALSAHFTSPTNWTSSHKLSGYAAVLYNLKFDKKGKVFASGVPKLGIVAQGVKVYDPRLDSTYAGGSGSHRIDDETTWAYSDNPALHAIAYCYGRYQNDKKVFGVGMPVEGIALDYFVSLANLCDTNGWTIGGVIYEPDDKWDNLKNILMCASAEPIFTNGQISVRYDAPVVSLDTITEADLTETPSRVPASQPWADRINGVTPRFRSEAHNWEYVDGDLFTVPAYVTEDGQEKNDSVQYNLVQDADQAAELAAYRVYNARELTPIELTVKARLRAYRPGEALTVNLPELGLNSQVCVIVSRTIDPVTMDVSLVLRTETNSKHASALGLTGGYPPTPTLFDTEAADLAEARLNYPAGLEESYITNSYVSGAGGNPTSATDAGSDATVNIAAHTRIYPDFESDVDSGSITGLPFSTGYSIYYDDADREGGAVTYAATTTATEAYNSATYPSRHFVGYITTPADGGGDTDGGGAGPPGSGGDGDLT